MSFITLRRGWLACCGLVLVFGGTMVSLLANGASRTDPGRDIIERYLAAWASGDDAAAADYTNRPAEASEALRANRLGLDRGRVRTEVRDLSTKNGRTTADVDVRWTTGVVPVFGYRIRLVADQTGDSHKLRWRERNVHPALDKQSRLGTFVGASDRGDIFDRRRRALVTSRSTVDIAVEVDRVQDPTATARQLSAILDVEPGALARRIRRAPKGRFIPVVTLRAAQYDARASALEAIAGLSTARSKAPLAPSRDFARATLGSVGPATAEQVAKSGGRIRAGDTVGQGGLQAQLEQQLTGRPDRAVVVRSREGSEQERVLRRWRGVPGKNVHTRLDRRIQQAAEDALGGQGEKIALAALDVSNGDVVAVANRPAGDGFDRALLGRYPPGSTFKVVSTAALLQQGLSIDELVDCPATASVDGRSFRNFEGGAQGRVAFRTDFAQSCNTAFVGLSDRLPGGALPRAAERFGLGRRAAPGVPTAGSSVPEPRGAVAEAAAMIGQDRILATPLAMAGVAAAVQEGRWRSPRLLDDAPAQSGQALAHAATLRELMREVVQSGTGMALADLPGQVIGKSGTAEYGGGDPPPTHAWFIASRGDIAVAVLVEGGSSGSRAAAPIARAFLGRLNAGAR